MLENSKQYCKTFLCIHKPFCKSSVLPTLISWKTYPIAKNSNNSWWQIRSRKTEMELMIPLRNPGFFFYFLSNLLQYTEKFVFVILKGMLLCYKVHMSKMIFWETHQFGNIEHFLSSPTYLENHSTPRASWTTFSAFLLRTVVTIQWFHDSEVFWQSVPLTSFVQKNVTFF